MAAIVTAPSERPGAKSGRVAYRDLREWIAVLEEIDQLARVRAEVDWKYELAHITRRTWDVHGDASPALLFENIKGYKAPGPNKVFVGTFRSWYRTAMMLGLDPETTTRSELIRTLRERINNRAHYLPPRIVASGPVKANIVKGDKVDMTMFPVPLFGERDGGRFIGTMHSVITRDPDTGWVNAGTYRMMMHNGQETGMQIDPANQHIGQHYYKYIEQGERMPVAVVIGQEPALTFMAASPTLDPVSEYDIAGAIRGEPIEVVKCETNDLYVPANAEIVLEGTVHPKERKLEGPGPEYAGYYANQPGMKPVFRCTAITFRDDPIFRATPEGHPINEDHMMLAINTSVYVLDALAKAGVPGVKDVAMPLDACGYGVCVVSIKPVTEGHADWVASAIWGTKMNIWSFKYVIVVDEDIDPWSSEQVNWSIAWRVKPSEDIKIWPRHKGSRLDPRAAPEEKGFQDRVLIDATRPYHWAPREIWGTEGVGKGIPLKFPPTTRPRSNAALEVNRRWEEYGIRPTPRYIGKPEGMFKHWWKDQEIIAARDLKVMP
jgi:4-hydroxy-3-polyprenylbenzoate decarboxylase